MIRWRTRVIVLLVAGLFLPQRSRAQAPPPALNYSRVSGAFDGNPPLGVRFEIRGAVESAIQSVRLEVLGFPRGQVPRAFRGDATAQELCAALDLARDQVDRVSHSVVAWDRTDAADRRFSLFQPPLFFGRQYVFLFTFFTRASDSGVRAQLEAELTDALQRDFSFEAIVKSGLTPENVRDVLMRSMPTSGCRAFVDRRLGTRTDLAQRLLEASEQQLAEIAAEAARRKAVVDLASSRARLDSALQAWNATAAGEEQARLRTVTAAVSATRYQDALDAANGFARARDDAEGRRWQALALTIAPVVRSAGVASAPALTVGTTVTEILRHLGDENLSEVLAATTLTPSYQTTREALPFLLSLDGGLVHVSHFREVLPALAINVKLNREDFQDPLARGWEWSVLVGLSLGEPDDLDPDYRGLFGADGKRALIAGLGVRVPGLSPLLRFQAGGLWYRQVNSNPLVRDLTTDVSPYFGVSANWDVLDFAAQLIRGRRSLALGLE